MTFSSFGLTDRLMQGIDAAQFTTPTQIQQAAIPIAMTGTDIIGCAQTGTGKTAAFVVPILQRLAQYDTTQGGFRPVRALILSPTRELAQQIEETTRSLARFMRYRICAMYGGVNIESQIKQLRYSMDIVIATPGRLLDHINRKSLSFSELEILVLDEADRMLDMGFINDVRKIVAQTPPQRQTMLFSATMSQKIQLLTKQMQRSPKLIDIGDRTEPAKNVAQHFYSIPQSHKMELLLHVLEKEAMESVIVFSRTKHGADRIARRLERKGLQSIAIHSNRSQSQRQRALAGFRNGQYRILVATDVAARGIDVDGISHVINFDTPPDAEDYIHRIGRTGRAEATGDALTFVSRDEEQHIRKIERHIGKRLSMRRYEGFTYVAPDAAEVAAIAKADADADARAELGKRRFYREGRPEGRSEGRSSEGRSFEGRTEGKSDESRSSHREVGYGSREGHREGHQRTSAHSTTRTERSSESSSRSGSRYADKSKSYSRLEKRTRS
jgi:ATP-dependent RNA helicase RhlE